MTGDIRSLAAAAAKGDANAFAKLYEMLAQDAYRYALYLTGHPQDAEDAAQNAAVKAYQTIGTLKAPDAFRSWYMRILHNACMDVIRSRREIAVEELPESVDTPDLGLRRDLADALELLSPLDRSIVLLHVLQGYKSREIAQMMGLNANTVRSKYSRAIEQLRCALS